MYCKLCSRERKLCQSHVVPESAYGPLYDRKHRFFEVANTQEKLRPLQKGLRERLLCEDCEQHLNKYDRYFADVWYQDGVAPKNALQELITIEGLDYHHFKLFHMSVLWRAGVASRDEFSQVQLGEHERILRNLILNDEPGSEREYPFFGLLLVFPPGNRVCQSLVAQPVCAKLFNVPGFHFIFGGCVWHYTLTSSLDFRQFPFAFMPKGALHLLRVEIDQYDPVMEIFKQRLNSGWRVEG